MVNLTFVQRGSLCNKAFPITYVKRKEAFPFPLYYLNIGELVKDRNRIYRAAVDKKLGIARLKQPPLMANKSLYRMDMKCFTETMTYFNASFSQEITRTQRVVCKITEYQTKPMPKSLGLSHFMYLIAVDIGFGKITKPDPTFLPKEVSLKYHNRIPFRVMKSTFEQRQE
ncbi:hypothetical protein [Prevotella aurantiaca]|uniref:hypothetical protein n=1 Tax=Prevotella aurantiaca TaxID=596085 RepID=UPI002889453F|nr:hypothetical protein [Prevotella aurantiaca]